jgi:hypothetical protein
MKETGKSCLALTGRILAPAAHSAKHNFRRLSRISAELVCTLSNSLWYSPQRV